MSKKKVILSLILGVVIIGLILSIFLFFIIIYHGSFGKYSCNLKNSEEKKICYTKIMAETNDVFLCPHVIRGDSHQQDCILERSSQIKSIDDCDEFESIPAKNYCKGIKAGQNQDISICNYLDQTEAPCYTAFAQVTRDVSVCERVQKVWSYEGPKNDCKIKVAGTTMDMSICDSIDIKWYDGCISELAEVSKNAKLCDLLIGKFNVTESAWDNCIREVAIATNNPELCTQMTIFNWKDGCLADVAEKTLNPEICKQISDDYQRERCQKHDYT